MDKGVQFTLNMNARGESYQYVLHMEQSRSNTQTEEQKRILALAGN
jgi:hypothetical protein